MVIDPRTHGGTDMLPALGDQQHLYEMKGFLKIILVFRQNIFSISKLLNLKICRGRNIRRTLINTPFITIRIRQWYKNTAFRSIQ